MPRRMHRAILPLTLPLLLLACGQSPSPTEDLGPYANGATYPWSYTAQSGRITPLTLDPGRNNLYYEPILSATNGWGPVEINKSNGEQARGDGRTLTVQGRPWDVGYGVHANSELRFDLKSSVANVNCTKLDGFVGVDDEVGDRGSVVFQIFLGSSKVFDSGIMTGKDAAKYYSVDLQGRTDLRMVVTDGGDNLYYDHANWLQPTVHCEQGTANPTPAPGSGSLDPTFGTQGRANVGGTDAALAPDGSIVVLGQAYQAPYDLTRLSPTGAVVGSWKASDLSVTPTDLAVQADGKIIVIGNINVSDNNLPDPVRITRYHPDFTVDTSFGTGGTVRFDANDQFEDAQQVVVQPDGKIVVVGQAARPLYNYNDPTLPNPGWSNRAFAVLRLNPDGTRDATFGSNGLTYRQSETPQNEGSTDDLAEDVAVQPDGRIVVVGIADLGGGSQDGMLVRLLPNGALDPAFGVDGGVRFGSTVRYTGVAVEPDGQILVTNAYTRGSGGASLTRFNASGTTVDRKNFSFAPIEIGSRADLPTRPIVTPNGKILVAGSGSGFSTASSVIRFNADLSFDESFGTGGFAKVIVGEYARDLLVQPDGKIVVVLDASTARLNP